MTYLPLILYVILPLMGLSLAIAAFLAKVEKAQR